MFTSIHKHFLPLFVVATGLFTVPCWAQTASPSTVCVVATSASGNLPQCFREPTPMILDDSRPGASRRTYEFRGDGRVVPYPR